MKRFLVVLGVLLSGCASAVAGPTVTLQSPDGKSVTVQVELARTQEEQAKGLMGRTELPEKSGMLFVFAEERPLSFWMKNTLIPLDILFFTAQGGFVSAVSMTPCTEEFCPSYASQAPALYALEVPAGFAAVHGVGRGWSMRLHE